MKRISYDNKIRKLESIYIKIKVRNIDRVKFSKECNIKILQQMIYHIREQPVVLYIVIELIASVFE